ncbi:hypothetical protein DFH06DRAFT_1250537 [Mycena polygramma]|nr:hypothetical protein DFH06DRAFT_1250537 [Mycena polygramma]
MTDTGTNNQRSGEEGKGDARVASLPRPVVRRRIRSFRGKDTHNPFDIRAVARLRRRWSDVCHLPPHSLNVLLTCSPSHQAVTNQPVPRQKFFGVLPMQWQEIITLAMEERATRATKKAAAPAKTEARSVLSPSSAVSASSLPPVFAAGGNATPTANDHGFTDYAESRSSHESQSHVPASAFAHDPAASSASPFFGAPHPAPASPPQDPFARYVASNPWDASSAPVPVPISQQQQPPSFAPRAPGSAFTFAPANSAPADIANPFACFLAEVRLCPRLAPQIRGC